ncbi:MAG TPA: hypothetical protein DGU45_09575 [Planctomycetes bacterium]|nr:hypothetical protein [Planctomycetota bacterium]
MKTLVAFTKALRFFWISTLFATLFTIMDLGLGIYSWVTTVLFSNTEGFLRFALGITLAGVLLENLLGSWTRRRQSIMARSLIRLQPGLQHVAAIEILIQAMKGCSHETAKTIHQELVRLSGKDFGSNPADWQKWLNTQKKLIQDSKPPVASRQTSESEPNDSDLHGNSPTSSFKEGQ